MVQFMEDYYGHSITSLEPSLCIMLVVEQIVYTPGSMKNYSDVDIHLCDMIYNSFHIGNDVVDVVDDGDKGDDNDNDNDNDNDSGKSGEDKGIWDSGIEAPSTNAKNGSSGLNIHAVDEDVGGSRDRVASSASSRLYTEFDNICPL